jgi:hypothetical protein
VSLSTHKILLVLFFAILFVAILQLRDTPRQTRLSENEFIALTVDLALAQNRYSSNPGLWQKEIENILARSRVTREQIEKFRQKVDRSPEKWAHIWNEVARKLQEKETAERRPKTAAAPVNPP